MSDNKQSTFLERRRNVNISPQELDSLCEQAARRGAKQALREIGLHDEDAGSDVRELRSLLTMYRQARGSVIKTVAKVFTLFVLASILIAVGSKYR